MTAAFLLSRCAALSISSHAPVCLSSPAEPTDADSNLRADRAHLVTNAAATGCQVPRRPAPLVRQARSGRGRLAWTRQGERLHTLPPRFSPARRRRRLVRRPAHLPRRLDRRGDYCCHLMGVRARCVRNGGREREEARRPRKQTDVHCTDCIGAEGYDTAHKMYQRAVLNAVQKGKGAPTAETDSGHARASDRLHHAVPARAGTLASVSPHPE